MEWHVADWTHYIVRWIHLIVGIGWIGSSFYFMWLDASLEKPKTNKPDVEGELWMVHSGGFYEVERKKIGPGSMPETLHWFKYEALFTWISGVCLLVLVYYMNAAAFMIEAGSAKLSATQSVWFSISMLVGTWFLYDGLWQSKVGKNYSAIATTLTLAMVTAATIAFSHYLSGRTATIHIGAMLGTWMVANVWVRILPAQQKMVDATKAGRTPDYALSGHAKKRSVHNTYMTFPVLFMMLSNHFPHVYGSELNAWIILLLIIFGAGVRHSMVGKDRSKYWVMIPTAVAALLLAVLAGQPLKSTGPVAQIQFRKVGFEEAHNIITRRCVTCHATHPAIDAFGPMPGGVVFDSPAKIKSLAERIKIRAIDTKTMPPANLSHITDEERAILGMWLEQGAKID